MKTIAVLLVTVLATGCGAKVSFTREMGAPPMAPLTAPVCIMTQPLPYEIPAISMGKLAVRKGGNLPGDVFDFLATNMRSNGVNVIQIGASNERKAWGAAFYVDPTLRLDCTAAGGMLR